MVQRESQTLPIAIMLIGFSGAGKSTYAQHLKRHSNATVISYDDIRTRLARETGMMFSEKDVMEMPVLMDIVEMRFHQEIVRATAAKENIIIDASHLVPARRMRTLSFFQNSYYKIATVFPQHETDKLLAGGRMRDQQRMSELNLPPRHVSKEFIEGQKKKFVMPSVNEGFDEVQVLERVAGVSRRSGMEKAIT